MAAWLAAVATVSAGCTGSPPAASTDSSTSAPSTTTSTVAATTPTTTTTTTRDEQADQKIATDALLSVDDFDVLDGTWTTSATTTASTTASAEDTDQVIFDTCTAIQDQLAEYLRITKGAPQANSDTFTFASAGEQIDEGVLLTATEEEAVTLANVFGDDKFAICLNDYFADQALAETAASVDPAGITVTRLKVGKLGDDHAVFMIDLPFTTSRSPAHEVFALIRVGRAYATIVYVSGGELSMADPMPLLQLAEKKLRKAMAT